MGIKFTFPGRFVSPLGFLGMLTFILFIILGITGALLMLWDEPILDRAWHSVENINDTIPYGFHIRNIHYHASNAMVMMAILHMVRSGTSVVVTRSEMRSSGLQASYLAS